MKRYRIIILLAIAGLSLSPKSSSAQVVIQYDGAGDLGARFEWAMKEGENVESASGFWVGYSFTRMMCEQCYSGARGHRGWASKPTLAELISGRKIDDGFRSVREAAQHSLDQLEGESPMVPKDIAVLFKFERSGQNPSDVELSNVSLAFDLGSRPLVWLGEASNGESIAFLQTVYDSNTESDVMKGAIWAIGMHDAPALAVPLLGAILSSDAAEEFRKAAAYGLGNQADEVSVRILKETALSGESSALAKTAVYALSNIQDSNNINALVKVLHESSDVGVRKAAVYALGNIDSEASRRILMALVEDLGR